MADELTAIRRDFSHHDECATCSRPIWRPDIRGSNWFHAATGEPRAMHRPHPVGRRICWPTTKETR